MDLEIKYSKLKLFLLLLIPVVIYIIPLSYIEGRSFCIFYNLFKIECFGCGFTRAFFNITRLNFIESIKYNKMILFLGPLFILSYFYELNHTIKLIKYKFSKRKSILKCLLNLTKLK